MRRRGKLLAAVAVALTVIPRAAFPVEPHPSVETSLARVRRIYVDQLGGGAGSDQMRDMLIASVQRSGLFVLTENPERADATLKGSSDQKFFTDEHQSSDSIGIHASEGTGSSSTARLGTSTSERQNAGAGISQSESSHVRDHSEEVGASVRLVDAEGDVIWSITEESRGAKFRGAMADVAEKIGRRLAEETRSARAAAASKPEEPAKQVVHPGRSPDP